MNHASYSVLSKAGRANAKRWFWRLVRLLTLRYLAGQALNGMLANPDWMAVAKKETDGPGRGDIPEFFGRVAARYARDTLNAIEADEPNIVHEPHREDGA